ncbi:MAG TPA: universal stress protein [Chthoniobacterales bacterium]|jgi:nucleotide-binding universal stress UspA family protein|nr:universal stress protein [Chthoniobacterales bacterium]
MRILICSDGTDPADNPTRLGGLIAGPCHWDVTLLGIAEKEEDEGPLRAALEGEANLLRSYQITSPRIEIRSGEPIRQILAETTANEYDVAIIGARRKGEGGLYFRPEKTYEVIKAVPPPVLVAIGSCDRVQRILVCTGGKKFIDDAVQLAGEIAKCVNGMVTLLHVMAEPPAIYADLVRMEEDVERLLTSDSELGRNLRGQKESLQKLGIQVEIRIRHGLALDQIFIEANEGNHDLIVTGTSQARGPFRHYIMGDLTRGVLNRAECPVLVARAGKIVDDEDAEGGFFHRLLHGFPSKVA